MRKIGGEQMKVAVLSDVHSNNVALGACIEYALNQGIETFLFLGDYFGECGNPEKTMDIICELKEKYECYFVKGNKEEAWLWYIENGPKDLEFGNSITGTLLYQYERRTIRTQRFFKELPITELIQWTGLPTIQLCHGSPFSTNQPIKQENEDCYDIMNKCEGDIILCGHTHRRRVIESGSKIAYNPGSVGAPLESGGKAQFMILCGNDGIWTEEFVDIEYDIELAIRVLHEEKLDEYAPYWCQVTEMLLRTGEISHGQVLGSVMKKCREETGECIWPYIPEKYWEPVMNEITKEMEKKVKDGR